MRWSDSQMVPSSAALLGACLLTLSSLTACTDDGGATDVAASETGDGDGDPGDGDGDTGDGDGDPTGDGDGDPSGDGDGEPNACDALVDGLNTDFDVDGVARSFYLDLPSDVEAGGPWPVVFSWHGLGDTASNFRGLFASAVDGPQMSFILVTPEDTDHPVTVPLAGTVGFDWDTFQVAADGAGNKEVALFDAVVECIDQRWGVDPSHLHSAGFSLGGVTTDMLATVRGEQLGSVATWSGGYWNDPANLGLSLKAVASWPALTVENPYAQLLVHGGPTDEFVVFENVYTMSFYEFALADTDFLGMAGHPLVVCAHSSGHTAPASVAPATVLQFFADHPLGVGTSPWVASPPNSGIDGCELLLEP